MLETQRASRWFAKPFEVMGKGFLELQFRAELDLPCCRRRCRDDARSWRDARRCGREHNGIRRQEVCVVEDVEELGAELEA
jgi:hypothetical protein